MSPSLVNRLLPELCALLCLPQGGPFKIKKDKMRLQFFFQKRRINQKSKKKIA
jgi:hypothetical protein